MKKIILPAALLFSTHFAIAQGCIPVRNLVGFGQFSRPQYDPANAESTKWLVNLTARYYESVQMYDGSSKLNELPLDDKENHVYVVNISVTRLFDKGWSYSIDIPISAADRTAWREHNVADSVRRTSHSFGINDIRLTVYKWLWDVAVQHRANIQVGLGIKLPTGDYRFQDYFDKGGTTGNVLSPVNQSIQLGDGGTGFTTEVNAFFTLNKTVSLYGNFFYLFNPRDHNGVPSPPSNYRHDSIPASTFIEAKATVNSVADSYTIRVGGNYSFNQFTLWSGVRLEGSPVHDVIGASNGQRRAGKIVSFEPGINYRMNKITLYAFVPVPFYRTTLQTVPDKRISEISGEYVSSPGGFANYLIFIGAAFKM